MERTLNAQLPERLGQRVKIAGWYHHLRRVGQVNFLLVRDRTSIAQVVLNPDQLTPLDGLQHETIIEVVGNVSKGPTELGVELHEAEIKIISPVEDPPPLDLSKKEVKASLPFLCHSSY